ncbi:hypothetical protein Hanom_Chr12g01146511 [Helianthus anomalus]
MAVGRWRWSLVSEDDGMPMNIDPPPAAAFVLTFRSSFSDEGLWFRRRWMVVMVADLCIVVMFNSEWSVADHPPQTSFCRLGLDFLLFSLVHVI